MNGGYTDNQYFGTEKISKILLKLAPPVMFAQLIQAMYNIVDSLFISKYSGEALTALSVVYPIQLLICAIGIGTGVGVNTVMARFYGLGEKEEAEKTAGIGNVLAVASWIVFALLTFFAMTPYANASAESETVRSYAILYGRIACVGSLGIFMESMWTKVLQAQGDMKTPMIAQIAGALINIGLDPILIFGWGGVPSMGVAGAAIATVIGQTAAAGITAIRGFYRPGKVSGLSVYIRQIYEAGFPNIIMQALWTVYISGLNMLLVSFSDAAVTVLGIYYKLQEFFFIPLFALGVCIVPVLSFNYAIGKKERCKQIFWETCGFSAAIMCIGVIVFVAFPKEAIQIFSKDPQVLEIGNVAFRLIGSSFLPAALSLTIPVFFQAIGKGKESITVTVLREVFLLVPLAWIFSRFGLNYFWLTFPVTELIVDAVGLGMYRKIFK